MFWDNVPDEFAVQFIECFYIIVYVFITTPLFHGPPLYERRFGIKDKELNLTAFIELLLNMCSHPVTGETHHRNTEKPNLTFSLGFIKKATEIYVGTDRVNFS